MTKQILSEYQKAAILDDSRACLVNANVGSGKTTVLTAKILYLHEQKKVDYRNMAVLTFTNKAAEEIKSRLAENSSELEEQMQYFGTFHSVALKLLKQMLPESRGAAQDIFDQNFTVIEPEEELALAEELIEKYQFKIKYPNRLKKRLEQVDKQSKCHDDIGKLRECLKAEKYRRNQMSFQDLINYVNVCLRVKSAKSPQIQWVIIDEVQDSDASQLEMIDCLMGKDTRLFAVGDPNQAIYSFRSGDINVFYKLKAKYDAKELSLPVNYRSSGYILKAAARFQQRGAKLSGVKEEGSKIIIRRHYNQFQEACYLADRFQQMHAQGINYREIAVFYRLAEQSCIFEDVFAKNDIPFEVSGKDNAQSQSEDAVKLMTLHASKGLEFNNVFIIGVNDGLIPLRTKTYEGAEEEGRLFFVGMTRAKQSLEISYYINPDYYGAVQGPGKYIRMLPKDMVQYDEVQEPPKEVHLQQLKRKVQKETVTQRTVKHEKYGNGVVIKEDENMIAVDFEGYGIKEFMKAFVDRFW